MKRWVLTPRAVVTGLVIVGSLWSVALAAETHGLPCLTEAPDSPHSACAPLTTWTIQLAQAQLAQYPPGHGTPQTY